MRGPAILSLLLMLAAGITPATATSETVLVQYGFDQETPTGPDTVRVFQNARGHVRLSSDFRYSGFGSVELRDIPGDRDFPELQGYFPQTREGHLYMQLALMIPDARQEMNIALAGPRGFRLGPDGIAFWLSTRDGWLFHTSDSIPKRLFEVDPFAWYVITVDYDVEAGLYDLLIAREAEEEPFLTKLDQPNAASQGQSAVSLFSFIGDNGDDLSSVVYYVDDVIVAREKPATLRPFVAPGRRSFFTDLVAEKPTDILKTCHPVHSLDELGIDPSLMAEDDWQALRELLEGRLPTTSSAALAVARDWRVGCSALASGRFQAAHAAFDRGLEKDPDALALELGRGLALAGLGQFEVLDRRLRHFAGRGQDPRFLHLHALAIAGTRDLPSAIDWLSSSAREAQLQNKPDAMADAYFTLLRLDGQFNEAFDYAQAMAEGLTPESATAALWFERAGQAAFALRDLDSARRAFESALAGSSSNRPWLALADIAWLAGDVDEERRLRESIYGRLAFE